MQENGVFEFLRDKVKEIHILRHYFTSEFYQEMKELKEQAKQMRIYFNGLEIDCVHDLLSNPNQKVRRDQYFSSNGLFTRVQQEVYRSNYPLASQTLPLYGVDYHLIEQFVGGALDLFGAERLPELQVVIVNKPVKDERTFGRWLSGSKTLLEILFRCSLSQEFYSNILPASCPTLRVPSKLKRTSTSTHRQTSRFCSNSSFFTEPTWAVRIMA